MERSREACHIALSDSLLSSKQTSRSRRVWPYPTSINLYVTQDDVLQLDVPVYDRL